MSLKKENNGGDISILEIIRELNTPSSRTVELFEKMIEIQKTNAETQKKTVMYLRIISVLLGFILFFTLFLI